MMGMSQGQPPKTAHERRTHFRGKARPGRVLPIRFRGVGEPTWTDSVTVNIGVGGAFIATAARAIGDRLELEIELPTTERKFLVGAAVRWIATTGAEIGMGVQFVDVDVDILLELNDYFSLLTAT